jgi:hypothetical protein
VQSAQARAAINFAVSSGYTSEQQSFNWEISSL